MSSTNVTLSTVHRGLSWTPDAGTPMAKFGANHGNDFGAIIATICEWFSSESLGVKEGQLNSIFRNITTEFYIRKKQPMGEISGNQKVDILMNGVQQAIEFEPVEAGLKMSLAGNPNDFLIIKGVNNCDDLYGILLRCYEVKDDSNNEDGDSYVNDLVRVVAEGSDWLPSEFPSSRISQLNSIFNGVSVALNYLKTNGEEINGFLALDVRVNEVEHQIEFEPVETGLAMSLKGITVILEGILSCNDLSDILLKYYEVPNGTEESENDDYSVEEKNSDLITTLPLLANDRWNKGSMPIIIPSDIREKDDSYSVDWQDSSSSEDFEEGYGNTSDEMSRGKGDRVMTRSRSFTV